MSIASTTRKAGPYACNGATVTFPFAFKVFSSADLAVTLTDTSGVESSLALTSNYTVSLNADQDANPGGSITTVTTYATGYLVTITSAVAQLQSVVLTNLGSFFPTILNDEFDKLTILIQQLQEQVTRSAKVPISGIGSLAASSLVFGVDGSGNPQLAQLANISQTAVSTFVNTLMGLTSADAFRSAIAVPGKNKIINGDFSVNQRVYVSGAAISTADLYGHDRWRVQTSGDSYTFSTVNNTTTVTIPVGKNLIQIIEGINLKSGTYVLSWAGTAEGSIGGGAYNTSPVTATIVGGTNTTIKFRGSSAGASSGTLTSVQLELASTASAFESRPYGLELALCQRYLPAYPAIGASYVIAAGLWDSTTTAKMTLALPVTPRVPPTSVGIPAASSFSVRAGGSNLTTTALVVNSAGGSSVELNATVASGGTVGQAATLLVSAAGYLLFNGCEL